MDHLPWHSHWESSSDTCSIFMIKLVKLISSICRAVIFNRVWHWFWLLIYSLTDVKHWQQYKYFILISTKCKLLFTNVTFSNLTVISALFFLKVVNTVTPRCLEKRNRRPSSFCEFRRLALTIFSPNRPQLVICYVSNSSPYKTFASNST